MSNSYKKIKDCACHDLEPGDLAELRLISHSGKVISTEGEYKIVVISSHIGTDSFLTIIEDFRSFLFYECLYFFDSTKRTFKIEDGRASFYPDNIDLPRQFCFRKIRSKNNGNK